MSPWERGRFPEYAPKVPPPAHGIKIKKLGNTWWGQHWIDALERVLKGDSGRLARGRAYARAGRTHDFVVTGGQVQAKVTGSRAPYQVSIELPQLPSSTWRAAIAFMARKAEFSALLLNREMPQQIDEAFRSGGASLFPQTRDDLRTACDCPDHGDPCKHIAAVHYVLGDALDRDPFLLFELRGRSREEVLGALDEARGSGRGGAKKRKPKAAADLASPSPNGVTLEKLSPKTYDAPPAPLPTLSFSFEPPSVHAAALRQLGAPRSWNHGAPPAEALSPIVRAAAEAARRLALSELDVPAPPLRAQEAGKSLAKRRKNGPRR